MSGVGGTPLSWTGVSARLENQGLRIFQLEAAGAVVVFAKSAELSSGRGTMLAAIQTCQV